MPKKFKSDISDPVRSPVLVTGAEDGSLITRSPNNPLWGWIMLSQERMMLDPENNILTPVTLHAFVNGELSSLRKLGWHVGQTLPGHIVIREQLNPFSRKMPEKDFKIAGDTGVVCTIEAQPIYRKTCYVTDPSDTDTLIQHDNSEEIKLARIEKLERESAQDDLDHVPPEAKENTLTRAGRERLSKSHALSGG